MFQQFDSSGADHGLRYVYTNGYLSELKEARDGASGTVYQDILAMDARGNVTNMTLGGPASGGYTAIIDASYEQSSGRLLNLSAYDGNGTEIQDVEYIFDVLGNLKQRHDQSGLTTNLNETFFYDNLNRLETVNLSLAGNPAATTMSLAYNEAGNIMSKSGVGTYLYDASRPHAVSNAGGIEYDYDANGNQISGDGRTITYTVFDKPDSISKDGDQVDFAYGVGNSRYQRIDSGPTLQRTTLYLGSVERITEGSSTYYKRYLGGVAIATYYPSTDTQNIAYLLKDHIGSIHTVLDEDAAITARMHFGAFGERQDMNWQSAFTGYQYALNAITTRGFTGHEQVDSMGIVHMNRRIYDPKLGRFLQADPIVQAPKNSQSLNRYTYVLNNPLSFTDPTGFSFWKKIRPFVSIGVMFIPGVNIVVLGAISGFIATGTIKGALIGAFSAAVFQGIGNRFAKLAQSENYAAGALRAGKILAHGIAGGVMSTLNGGKFGHGFWAAGFTQAFAGPIGDIDSGTLGFSAQRVIAAAVVGGTASELSGGKFANGAVTSAFSRAFNDEANHGKLSGVFENKKLLFKAGVALGQSKRDVGAPDNGNVTLGLAIFPDGKGGFIYDEYPNNRPNSHAALGDRVIPGTGRGIEGIEGAAALTISLPKFRRDNAILTQTERFQAISVKIDAPVFVGSPGAINTYLFFGNNDPVQFDFRRN